MHKLSFSNIAASPIFGAQELITITENQAILVALRNAIGPLVVKTHNRDEVTFADNFKHIDDVLNLLANKGALPRGMEGQEVKAFGVTQDKTAVIWALFDNGHYAAIRYSEAAVRQIIAEGFRDDIPAEQVHSISGAYDGDGAALLTQLRERFGAPTEFKAVAGPADDGGDSDVDSEDDSDSAGYQPNLFRKPNRADGASTAKDTSFCKGS